MSKLPSNSSSSSILRKIWIQFGETDPMKFEISEDMDIYGLKERVKIEFAEFLNQIHLASFKLRYYNSKENLLPDTLISNLDSSVCSARTPIKINLQTTEITETYQFNTIAKKSSVIAPITGVNDIQKNWTDTVLNKTVKPSKDFLAQYKKNCRVWSMNSEASCRTFIDLFLRDVLARDEFHDSLRIFCELSLSAEEYIGNKKLKLTGQCDYTIGHAGGRLITDHAPPKDSHIIAVEAKKDLGNDDLWLCIAEAAALFKSRKLGGKKNCNVWGILSNGNNWKFLHIDNDGQIFLTGLHTLDIPQFCPISIVTVYQYVHYIVRSCYMTSPQTTPIHSLDVVNE